MKNPGSTVRMKKPKLDKATIQYLIEYMDASPVVTWTGKGGVKELIHNLLAEEPDDGVIFNVFDVKKD